MAGNNGLLRKRYFHLHLLDEEFDILNMKASTAGMSKSQYLRNMILYGAAHKRSLLTQEESEKVLYELNRIGNNINQIAWRANTLKGADKNTLLELKEQFDLLLQEFEDLVRG